MHRRAALPDELRVRALAQAGVLSRHQLMDAGVSRTVIDRFLRDRQLDRIAPGVYVIGGRERAWETHLWAGLLLGGPDARAGGLTAARLGGLVDGEPMPIEILVPGSARRTPRDWVRFIREDPGVRMPSFAGSPRRLRIEDTVLDLCARGTPGDVVTWTSAAVQRRLTTPRRILEAMRARDRMAHRDVVREILTNVADGVHSNLEYRFVRDVERPHGLPSAIRQFRVPGTGAIADAGYPAYRLLLELDGRGFHSGVREFRDRDRDNRHAIAGWTTVRYGTYDVYGAPCGVARHFAGLLVDHGWEGAATQCPRCPEDRTR